MDPYLIAQQAKMKSLEAELAGMIAFNQIRISNGDAPGYEESNFLYIKYQFDLIYNEIIKKYNPEQLI